MTDEIPATHPFRTALFETFKSGLGQVGDEYDSYKSPDRKTIGYCLVVNPSFPRKNLQPFLSVYAYDLKREPITEDAIKIVVTYDQLKPEFRPVLPAPAPAPTAPQAQPPWRRTLNRWLDR